MFKKNIYIIKLKNSIIPFLFLLFTIGLVLYSSDNISSAKSGLLLWVNSIVPSLLPFFIATELLCSTNIVHLIGNLLTPIMKPLFNISGEGSFAFIMGIISGYPTGAKIAAKFRNENICTKEECERLLSFTNNSGPLFIIGTVGISMFGNSTIGLLLFITHILASITVGIIFRFWKYKNNTLNHELPSQIKLKQKNNINMLNLGEIIGKSITNSISTIIMIGGFVVFFSVITSILKASNLLQLLTIFIDPIFHTLSIPEELSKHFITGLIEITGGINCISNIQSKNISINIIVTSFLLGFGGLSVMLQVFSIISKTDLSPKPYVIGKLLHGFIASFYTYAFIYSFSYFNFNLM